MTNTKSILSIIFLIAALSCTQNSGDKAVVNPSKASVTALDSLMDAWHVHAAKGDFTAYFDLCSPQFVFLGTDSTERWDKESFMDFCRPHFEDGKGWDFKRIDRYWDFSSDQQTAWFDERLDTWMKDCRGTGVLEYLDGNWKISHYSLSVTVENDLIQDYLKIKEQFLDSNGTN